MNKYTYILLLSLVLISCSKKNEEPIEREEPLFTEMDPKETGIHFINEVTNEKEFNIFTYRNFYNGGGVGIGDINNDGLPDVYLTSNMGENKLYLNKGNFEFEDITQSSGTAGTKSWSTGVTMVDINGNGLLDIYVSNAGNVAGDDQKNELFINNGDLTFTERAEEFNLADAGFTTHVAFFDYDNDGDLDVYILNNSFIPVSSLGYTNKREVRSDDWDIPDMLKGGGDKLMRNDNGVFTDVSEEAGIYGSLIGFGLGVTVGDVNGDLLPDIYVSNDFYERDYLYINQGDGTFKEEIREYIQHLSLSSMGADMADINNDGLPEIFVTDMLPEEDRRLKETGDYERYDLYVTKLDRDFYHQYMHNTLQLNNGNGTFSEIAHFAGVGKTDWSWSALMFDMDNDGYKDIFVSNGIYHDLTNNDFMDFFASEIIQRMTLSGKKEEVETIVDKMPSTPISNYAFKNNKDLTFTNVAKEWGLDKPGFSNGSAYGDLDNDGDLDLIVNNLNSTLSVYRNNSEKLGNNFLKVRLEGEGQNTRAIGSAVEIYVDNEILRQEVMPTRGFQSSVEYTLTFGLGKRNAIDSIRVIYPNRKMQVVTGVKLNETLVLQQSDAPLEYKISPPGTTPVWFTDVPHNFEPHKEDRYVDYNFESLLPKMQSREGPAIAIGDIDQDGNEDVFIGGAYGQHGRIYLQKQPGKFSRLDFEAGEEFEDTDAKFLDINGNGSLDLVVASGGNFQNARTGVRVYINEGNNRFSNYKVLAFSEANISTIAPFDYDDDGDIDLFVGGFSIPGKYGTSVSSMLLENDGKGNFRDVTGQLAPALKDVGMVKDATWADVTNNGQKDLIIVGEWMAPGILVKDAGVYKLLPTNLDSIPGMYNTVYVNDLNGNGNLDIVLGNRGSNASYSASTKQPAKMFVADFDNNGSIEQIFTKDINGRDVPLHTKRELTGQIVSLKKQNLKFDEYANKSIDELFPSNVLDNAVQREITNFESVIAYNNGNGTFTIEKLPSTAQISSVNSIVAASFSKNTGLDLVVAGNQFNLKPQFSRLDASYGNVLLNDSNGFKAHPSASHGFFLKGEVRAMEWLKDRNGQRYLLVGINNESPKLFKFNESVE